MNASDETIREASASTFAHDVPTSDHGLIVTAVLVVLVALGGSAAVSAFYRSAHRTEPLVTASPSPPAATSSTPERMPSSDDVIELGSPDVPSAPADGIAGALRLPPAAGGHRVYVDGRVVGDASNDLRVACGRHVIKVGSRGHERDLVVPCGGQVIVAYP